MMSSHRTTLREVLTRKSGAASIAQASDAHEAKMARFSFRGIGVPNDIHWMRKRSCRMQKSVEVEDIFFVFHSILHGHSSIRLRKVVRLTDHLNSLMD